jgi:hypothetical protein
MCMEIRCLRNKLKVQFSMDSKRFSQTIFVSYPLHYIFFSTGPSVLLVHSPFHSFLVLHISVLLSVKVLTFPNHIMNFAQSSFNTPISLSRPAFHALNRIRSKHAQSSFSSPYRKSCYFSDNLILNTKFIVLRYNSSYLLP